MSSKRSRKQQILSSNSNVHFQCNWCNQEFKRKKDLSKHFKKCNERTVKRRTIFKRNRTYFDIESSLNDYVLCNWCNRAFRYKRNVYTHLKSCSRNETTAGRKKPTKELSACTLCNMLFDAKKSLSHHMFLLHNIRNANKNSPVKLSKCNVCHQSYTTSTQLQMHIRREHFNLQAKIPYCEQKKVNQVWFEKVLNCNNIMEIKKTAPNTLVMRRLDEKTAIKVVENNTETIDLSKLYPVKRLSGTAC